MESNHLLTAYKAATLTDELQALTVLLVPMAGLEPARPLWPAVFKTDAYTISPHGL